jgi:hypothetical protein
MRSRFPLLASSLLALASLIGCATGRSLGDGGEGGAGGAPSSDEASSSRAASTSRAAATGTAATGGGSGVVCGDGFCQVGESCMSCPADCTTCQCGNGACETGESCMSCPADCGSCCSHPVCDTGIALTSGCEPCVTKLCSKDAFCCSDKWDAKCKGEVKSICGITCP